MKEKQQKGIQNKCVKKMRKYHEMKPLKYAMLNATA